MKMKNGQNTVFSKKCFLMLTWLGLVCCCELTAQTTWFVATNGVDNTETGRGESWALPFATIANAVQKAADNDVVQVSNGVYVLDAQIDITKGVTIKGINTPGQTNTVADGQNTVRGFRIRHKDAIVDGFVITNCGQADIDGGGVYMTDGLLRNCVVAFNNGRRGGGIHQNTAGVISNCVVVNNTSHSTDYIGGGGVVLYSSGVLIDSIIEGNTANAYNGGGVHVFSSSSQIINCRVSGNEASSSGGGIYVTGSEMVLSNVDIIANQCNLYGGGLYISGSDVQVTGGSILFNTNTWSSGGGVVVANDAVATISDVSICSNSVIGGAGSGIYVYGQALIADCNVIGNQCFNQSGAIAFHTTGEAGFGTVTCSRVIGNISDGGGKDCLGAGIKITNAKGPVLIENCEITGNGITNANIARGGGVYANSHAVVRNCLIQDNWVEGVHASDGGQGGGVYCTFNSLVSNEIESCTIVSNYARLHGGGVYFRLGGADIVRNSIVVSNSVAAGDDNWHFGNADRKANVSYTCTPDADGDWGAGCISADPLFVDPVSGDYRLRVGSPGINAGINQMDWMTGAVDLDGNPRIDRFSRQVDMGCYERLYQGTLFYIR